QDGSEGFDVLRSVEAPVKVLWTAAADAPGVKETAKDCGANRVFHKYDTRQMLDFLRRGLE
ncbi:hypothetical protein KY319_03385, partial [Candidatus Woesearchaeota archaeon]|nr:hypothetical protein [Candidatus Woesearchaeota archaeon]